MKVRKIVKSEVEVEGLHTKIAEARVKSKKTVKQVCNEVGISRVYWNRVINGDEYAIAYTTICKIEEVLNADFGIKINGDECAIAHTTICKIEEVLNADFGTEINKPCN